MPLLVAPLKKIISPFDQKPSAGYHCARLRDSDHISINIFHLSYGVLKTITTKEAKNMQEQKSADTSLF